MDGVLVVDKPQGLTSHDVVALARRALGERRIGHTGTLDPLATGVLALACGRATRLAPLLSGSEKEYLAEIRFGLTTDSYDITGLETSRSGEVPERAVVEREARALRGERLQLPPPVSAKKIQGQRAYALARAGTPVQPAAVRVRASVVDLHAYDRGVAVVRLVCSAGFYVRSFAHELGARCGSGACLQALERRRSGSFTLTDAVSLTALQEEPGSAWAYFIPLDRLLPEIPGVAVTAEGLTRVSHGRDIGPEHAIGPWPVAGTPGERLPDQVRITDHAGALVALGWPADDGRSLHPAIVLG
ncbi:MAG: tRNA pseudouridine(55) synthase TruB [Acidimicrobiia bacterium]|nr:tRNA pseudouridine(55) synthase TruB [Acidimicrobiia bacterium]